MDTLKVINELKKLQEKNDIFSCNVEQKIDVEDSTESFRIYAWTEMDENDKLIANSFIEVKGSTVTKAFQHFMVELEW